RPPPSSLNPHELQHLDPLLRHHRHRHQPVLHGCRLRRRQVCGARHRPHLLEAGPGPTRDELVDGREGRPRGAERGVGPCQDVPVGRGEGRPRRRVRASAPRPELHVRVVPGPGGGVQVRGAPGPAVRQTASLHVGRLGRVRGVRGGARPHVCASRGVQGRHRHLPCRLRPLQPAHRADRDRPRRLVRHRPAARASSDHVDAARPRRPRPRQPRLAQLVKRPRNLAVHLCAPGRRARPLPPSPQDLSDPRADHDDVRLDLLRVRPLEPDDLVEHVWCWPGFQAPQARAGEREGGEGAKVAAAGADHDLSAVEPSLASVCNESYSS
ncbi:uncharacterized protein RHOBADRAFT_51890, partial [Rhodotorula graminis WP1]